jgi:hypothetical protein
MLGLIQFFVDDLNIYYKEILFQVPLIEHLYKLFELVLMVLYCFYLWEQHEQKKKKIIILVIDQYGERKSFFLLEQWQDSMFCILFARWESGGIGWIMICSFIIVNRKRCGRARARTSVSKRRWKTCIGRDEQAVRSILYNEKSK